MSVKFLSTGDLAIAALLIVLAAITSVLLRLDIGKALIVSASRAMIQLLLIGLVLKILFQHDEPVWIALICTVMLAVATREITARQRFHLIGYRKHFLNGVSLFITSFTLAVFASLVIIQNEPWYSPQYAIPLLGMLLGNTMNGIALSMDRLNQAFNDQREVIEQRLALGESYLAATQQVRKDSARSGMMPIINAMTTAGLVNLPGMMTGQILGGVPPSEAVKYQILILFLIAASTVLGVILSISLGTRQLFDNRERLRLDRLTTP